MAYTKLKGREHVKSTYARAGEGPYLIVQEDEIRVYVHDGKFFIQLWDEDEWDTVLIYELGVSTGSIQRDVIMWLCQALWDQRP